MIGIVIPAHNEATHIADCVCAAVAAGRHPLLYGEQVEVLVVLDSCSDDTASIAHDSGARTLAVSARNVGKARSAGAEELLQRGARWLSFTDADTIVSEDWLVNQLALQMDAVCGTVQVDDWSEHTHNAPRLKAHFAQTYHDIDGHGHIHGANLGVSAVAYRKAGGFKPLACSEDVNLVEALRDSGARIAWSAVPRVTTSARTQARARGGFGDTLLGVVARFSSAA